MALTTCPKRIRGSFHKRAEWGRTTRDGKKNITSFKFRFDFRCDGILIKLKWPREIMYYII